MDTPIRSEERMGERNRLWEIAPSQHTGLQELDGTGRILPTMRERDPLGRKEFAGEQACLLIRVKSTHNASADGGFLCSLTTMILEI